MAKPTDYNKLRDFWYKKLKKAKSKEYPDGFKDIEQDEYNLKLWSTEFSRQRSMNSWQAKEAYYHMATKFLNDYKFETKLDQIIWEYHTNGISVRDIANLLRKAKITDRTGAWVHKFVILRLRQEMKRMYMHE